MATDTRLYWIWMQEAVGRGNPLGKKLLETFGGPEAVYNADPARRSRRPASKEKPA